MKKTVFLSLFLASFVMCADAATVRRGQSAGASADTPTTTTSARAASTTATRGTTVRGAAPSATTTAARSAATPVARTTAARSGTTPTTISARAGVTQKVVNTGTKVAAANENIVVNDVCRQKYYGCMDSFCMLDNTNGGRCLCSDKNADLDKILVEIEALDLQSYKMATEGVEKIEMGSDADAVMANTNAITNSIKTGSTTGTKSKRRTLDLSMWDAVDFSADDDVFGGVAISNSLNGKTGDAMHRAAAELCIAQMPECGGDLSMLQLMYAQQVRSDCSAYENNLKQQKNTSQNKLAAAERALREAALEQLRSANRWDLGQCTVQFKNCMASTGGCGTDFTGCVGIHAAENAKNTTGKANVKMYDIKGSATKISIAASTYDTLDSKKPLCMNVTNSCVAVRDQVWDTFLREVGPQLKTAELLAESDLRMNCIANISDCFQKACKDTIDPNDPEGSYDMCLSRPETVKSLCRVQIDPCVSAEPLILDFVYARLAGMRVDSCTKQVKECLQSEDRCGSDYTQCVGLDTDTIVRMCPYDKLVGCQQVYSEGSGKTSIQGEEIYDKISHIIQGVLLGIDNSLLNKCMSIAESKMIEICGDSSTCDEYFLTDSSFGSDALGLNMSQADEFHVVGIIDFGQLSSELLSSFESIDNSSVSSKKLKAYEVNGIYAEKSQANVNSIVNKINNVVALLESDEKVKQCVNGRSIKQIRTDSQNVASRTDDTKEKGFVNLLDSYILTIIESGLKKAQENHAAKRDSLIKEAVNRVSQIMQNAADTAGNGICYDAAIMGELDFMK